MFPNSPHFPPLCPPPKNAAKKRRLPRSFSLLPTSAAAGIPTWQPPNPFLGTENPCLRLKTPQARLEEPEATRGLRAAGQHHGQLPPLPPLTFHIFKEFSSHSLKVFLPHTLPKPLQSRPTAVFREEIIMVRFQVSKRRRSPEGSRAAERSKINVHVFSPSGGLRRGLRESLPAGRLQS